MLRKPEILLKKGKYQESLTMLQETLNREGESPAIFLRIANAHKSAGDSSASEKIYLEGIKKFPENNTLLLFFGKLLSENERYPEAVQILEKCISLNKENKVAYGYYIISLYAVGRYEEAKKLLIEKGIDTNPELLSLFSVVCEGLLLEQPDKFPEISDAERFIHDSAFLRYFYSLKTGSILRLILQNFASRILMKKSGNLINAGNYKAAREIVLKVLEIYPDYDDAMLSHAITWFEEKHFDKARDIFLQIIEIKGDYPILFAYLGICLYNLNDLDNADLVLSKVPLDGPEDYTVNYYRGLIYLKKGDKKKAGDFFKAAHSTFFIDTSENCLKPLIRRMTKLP